ncbi:ribosome recycling factor [Candidatus Saccharibacteria bacterium]|nr:ribosome recycling factor [Candidatus Saccharibacteria bacterium]NCU40248.1 ribosome recycling factor [Candidatus Saccharibacteria bacterium]
MFDTKPYEKKMESAIAHLEEEMKKIRTGRAHPDMLDSVIVKAYGATMPLVQVANITVPESQMIMVSPFDPSHVQAIAAAIRDASSLGFNPTDDGRVIRVPVPPLTEERRRDMVKQLSDKVEECRITLRTIRQEAIKDARRKKDAKELSEDDVKAIEKGIDDSMRDYQTKIDEVFKAKEKEVMTV